MIVRLLAAVITILIFVSRYVLSEPKSGDPQIPCGSSGYQRIDNVSATLFVFGDHRPFPTNEKENVEFCRDGRRMEKTIKDYTRRCLEGIGRTIIQVTITNIGRTNKIYCSDAKAKVQMLSAGQCGNANRPGAMRCMQGLVDGMVDGKQLNDSSLKLPIVCCNYFKWKQCTMSVYKTIGTPKCTEPILNFWSTYIDQHAIELLKTMCGDYEEDSMKCRKLLESVPKPKKRGKTFRSPVLPVVNLFRS